MPGLFDGGGRKVKEQLSFRITRWIFLVSLAIFVAVPLYMMVITSVKPLIDVQGPFTWWPSTLTIEPYIKMWNTVPLANYIRNSLIVATTASGLSVFVALLGGYAVSRARFLGRGTFMTLILSTQMFPGILFLLPLYLIYVQMDQMFGLRLIGTPVGLIITYLTFALPFSVWMLSSYLEGISRELDEAAALDGAGVFRTLFSIILPPALPGVIAVWVFSFIVAWGEVLFAAVLTTKDTRTVAIGLQQYASEQGTFWNEVMAASLVVSLPMVLVFLLLQRFLVSGLTAGSVK
jgi:multiple sugar transport system permease protein